MKTILVSLTIGTSLLLGGCQTLQRTARVNPAGVSARPAPAANQCPLVSNFPGDKKFAIDLGCFRFDPRSTTDTHTAYYNATNGEDDDQKYARNRLEAVLLNQANLICEQEKGNLYANRAMSSSVLDFLSSGFSLTSTIVGGEQAKSIFSGLAGLSTATRTNVDANIYQNQLVSAITKVMDAERKRILIVMQGRKSNNIKDYSADEMIRLANEYHQACSFQKGMQLLLDAAVNKEGVDRIIEGINLRTNLKNLKDQRAIVAALESDEAAESLKEIDKKIGELSLKQSANTAGAESVTIQDPQ